MRLKTGATEKRLTMSGMLKAGLVAAAMTMLAGCSGGDLSDLQQYVRAEKAKPPGRLTPVPEFKSYEIFYYSAAELRDPFKAFESDAEIVSAPSGGIPGPDLTRNRETLESFPLDTLKFVGHLDMAGEEWAIITSPDSMVHRVKVGNYIGINFGKIVDVTESTLMLEEVVSDGRGGWIEREAALSLTE